MNPLPQTDHPIVLRTDFTDDAAWVRLSSAISSPISKYGYLAQVDLVNDRSFADVTVEVLLAAIAARHSFIIIADRITFSEPEQPLLVMDLSAERGRTFRALPTRLEAIESNLSIGNMGFEDFADSVDDDGIFRKFPGEDDDRYKVVATARKPKRTTPSPPKTLLGRALIGAYKLLRGNPKA
jgi:hypothetical protein